MCRSIMECLTFLSERVEIHDPEILALVSDLGLVPGPPSRILLEDSFEDDFEEMRCNDIRYIMRGLNPRYHRFRARHAGTH